MSTEDRIGDLLLRWEDEFDKGHDMPAAELCRECPELVEEVAQRIGALKRTAWIMRMSEDAPPSDPPLTGTVLAGRYRLDRKIGSGGFGQVWAGFDLELQRAVAIKMPKPGHPSAPTQVEEILAEARKVARLKHSGVVAIHDVGRHEGTYFFVSDLVEGTDLRQRILTNRPPPQEAARIVADVAGHLAYAHSEGFIHRDIKPANILLDNHDRAFITDFGIAVSSDDKSAAGAVGTLVFMSPEQIEGHPADQRSDIYALGLVLYELLTGALPFQGDDPAQVRQRILHDQPTSPKNLNKAVPAELDRICAKCMAKRPESRYQSAQELAADLSAHLGRRRFWPYGVSIVATVLSIVILVAGTAILMGVRQSPPDSHSPQQKPSDPSLPPFSQPDTTIEQLLAAPAEFAGCSLVFRNILLSGTLVPGPVRKRLILKTPGGSTIKENHNENSIIFVVSQAYGDELAKKMAVTKYYPVTLTCNVEKGQQGKKWLVIVSKAEFEEGEPIADQPPTAPQPSLQLGAEVNLFNGQDLSGWTVHSKEPIDKDKVAWAKDGTLVLGKTFGYWICSEAKFSDFVLRLEYRLPAPPPVTWLGGGVMLRATDPDATVGKHLRMKIGTRFAGRVLLPHSLLSQKSARMSTDPNLLEKPLGEWNQLEIRCSGTTITAVLNDHPLPAVNDVPERLGGVGLNCHAVEMEFRHIKVAEIIHR